MYTILVNNDNSLITSVRTRIIQGTSNIDCLHILTQPIYNNIDLRSLKVIMTYTLPNATEPATMILAPSEELYKDRLEYKITLDYTLTSEIGDIYFYLTFIDESANIVRKTTMGTITISPIKEIDYQSDKSVATVDNIHLDKTTNELYLTANGQVVGNTISMNDLSDSIIDTSSSEGLVTVITEEG